MSDTNDILPLRTVVFYGGKRCVVIAIDYHLYSHGLDVFLKLQCEDGTTYRQISQSHVVIRESCPGARVFYQGALCEIVGIEYPWRDMFGPNTMLKLREIKGEAMHHNVRWAKVQLSPPAQPAVAEQDDPVGRMHRIANYRAAGWTLHIERHEGKWFWHVDAPMLEASIPCETVKDAETVMVALFEQFEKRATT